MQSHPKFAQKVEHYLTDVVLQRSSRSFVNLTSAKRNLLTLYVFEHFKLDMCTYGGKVGEGKTVTDVFWKEGCRVPDILGTDVVSLIEKGLISGNHEATRNKIFEASLEVSGIPKGSGIDDVKKLLISFRNEYYPERKGSVSQGNPIYLHFYSKLRAKDALDLMRMSAHQFGNIEMISHRKEIGTNATPLVVDDEFSVEAPKRLRANKGPADDDGFTVVKRQ